MKEKTLFNYSFLFGDHMSRCSEQARLYYIKLNFYADNGFVANPIGVLDSMNYDKGVMYELINNGDLLKLEDRSEVFITAYFIHNNLKPMSWLKSPFAVYWKNKLFIKPNGVATFKPQNGPKVEKVNNPLEQVEEPEENEEFYIPEGEWSTDDLSKGYKILTKEQNGGILTDEEARFLEAFKAYIYGGRR